MSVRNMSAVTAFVVGQFMFVVSGVTVRGTAIVGTAVVIITGIVRVVRLVTSKAGASTTTTR